MNDLDEKIREALRKEDRKLFRELAAEPSLRQMMGDVFRSRMRFWAGMVMGYILIFVIIGVYCLVELFNTDHTREQIIFATGFLLSMLFVLGLKIWWWMEMNKNVVLREIKKVELQLAQLASQPKED